ncbi:MAG: amidohydrolase family protein [Luteitalea sp.]|nr:amidohydrolase family protein [Luteitalea sp.]
MEASLIVRLATTLILGLSVLAAAEPLADAVYYNGKIITLWDATPAAQALAVAGNTFLAVGTNDDVLRRAGANTAKIDLKGQTVVPGLIDAHTHPIGAALAEAEGPLPPFDSIAAIQAYIRDRAAHTPADTPIVVPKVFATRLAERRYPTRQELDEVAADRAVLVDNGYASVLNSMLLEKHGITRESPDPKGGKLGRDERGEPNGLVLGASELLSPLRQQRAWTPRELADALKRVQARYNSVGITSTIDRAEDAAGFRAYQALRRENGLTVRTSVTYRLNGAGSAKDVQEQIEALPFVTGWGDEWLRVGPLKVVVDGGMLIGTAYLREPYGTRTDVYGYTDPAYRGELATPPANLRLVARLARDLGWQMTAHVVGGGALDVLLDAYEAADEQDGLETRRFTATHANFPDARAIARARQLGIGFDVQPAWLYLDGDVLRDVLGPQRVRDLLPLRSLFDAGLVVAGGSDHMVRLDPRNATNPYDPFLGMWIAITRQTHQGTVLVPEERLTRLEALRMWTLNPAWMTFEEDQKGSIQPGKLADFVVISKDLLTCPVDEIKEIDALLTIVDGRDVYRASGRDSETRDGKR